MTKDNALKIDLKKKNFDHRLYCINHNMTLTFSQTLICECIITVDIHTPQMHNRKMKHILLDRHATVARVWGEAHFAQGEDVLRETVQHNWEFCKITDMRRITVLGVLAIFYFLQKKKNKNNKNDLCFVKLQDQHCLHNSKYPKKLPVSKKWLCNIWWFIYLFI